MVPRSISRVTDSAVKISMVHGQDGADQAGHDIEAGFRRRVVAGMGAAPGARGNRYAKCVRAHASAIGDPERSRSAPMPRYNPAAESRLNIVPGLVGTILTMTMLIFTHCR